MTTQAAARGLRRAPGNLDEFFDGYATHYTHAKRGQAWCYEDGCVYRGLIALYEATQDERWYDHFMRMISRQVGENGELLGYSLDDYNIDNILTGRALMYLLDRNVDERYAKAADLLSKQLKSHPRTDDRNYWHKQIYPYQVWLDGLYMGLPFQIEYALRNNQPERVADAMGQLKRALGYMHDPRTGLYYHAYDEKRAQFWADPETGLSASLWGRAVGWLAMALVDILALLPADDPSRGELISWINDLGDALLAHRTEGGLWLQVMDRPDLEGNYEETSASAMFAYALLRAGRLLGSSKLSDAGASSLKALTDRYVSRTGDGVWELTSVCEVAGLGPFRNRQRDGSPEYYLTEAIVSNDPKGVGPLMMAVVEDMQRN